MNFFVSILMPLLFSLLLLAIPFYHQFTHRDIHPALLLNVDSVCGMAGLVGLGACSAIVALHRRISALEKTEAACKANSPGI